MNQTLLREARDHANLGAVLTGQKPHPALAGF